MTFSCCKERRRRRQPLVSPESQFLPRSRSYDRQAQEPRPCVLRPEQHTSPCRRPRSPGSQSAPTTQSIPTEQNLCWAAEHHGAHAQRQPRALLKGPPCCYGNISDISGTGGLLQSSPPWGFWVCFFIKSKFCSCSYFCEVLFSKHHGKAC